MALVNSRNALVKCVGNRPLLFDRYPGSNEARLEPIDKCYWHEGIAVLPQINLYSGLSAENTKSVTKIYFGKKAKPIGLAIQNSLYIKELYIPITRDGEVCKRERFEDQWEIHHHVARINKGGTAVPNPKERPCLPLPWEMEFNIQFFPQAQGDLTWDVMCQCFQLLGIISVGTYRPLYGGFDCSITEL